jgi:membrane protein involved in colicin uptake
MTDSPPDDARLRATETQMRNALGLRGDTPPRSSASGSQPQRRRFVRDGEVPVTVIRRDHQPDGEHGANQLDAARQAIRSEATAKERAERLLAEAQAMIRDLQTKLGHERLAKDEALETVRRLETEARVAALAQETAEAELAAERLARRNAENTFARALEARQEAERRLRDALTARTAQRLAMPSMTRSAKVGPLSAASVDVDAPDSVVELHAGDTPVNTRMAEAPTIVEDGPSRKRASRRGRPTKIGSQDSKVVEWWKPGWQRKSR